MCVYNTVCMWHCVCVCVCVLVHSLTSRWWRSEDVNASTRVSTNWRQYWWTLPRKRFVDDCWIDAVFRHFRCRPLAIQMTHHNYTIIVIHQYENTPVAMKQTEKHVRKFSRFETAWEYIDGLQWVVVAATDMMCVRLWEIDG